MNSIGEFDLILSGPRGIYQTFLVGYYYWLTNLMKQATFQTRMTFRLLKTLDLQSIHLIFNSRFLIKEAKVTVSDDEMADVEIEWQKPRYYRIFFYEISVVLILNQFHTFLTICPIINIMLSYNV